MKNIYQLIRALAAVIFIVLFLNPLHLFAQDFKTIGYLPYYRFDHIDQIDLNQITHLNIAFANPDMSGNLSVGGADISPIVENAHQSGVEVFLSLAGGALIPDHATAWKELTKSQNRSGFIQKIITYTLNHDLQGIDVDLEWSHVDENYSGFVLELKDSCVWNDLLLTAALPGTYRYAEITDEALASYDWINMMVYDLTGPWAPNNPGPHSPYSFAVNSIDYWENQGVEKERLTLGVPFYGYDFGDPTNVHALTYRSIVSLDPANAQTDQAGDIYYNGMPTIEAKTFLALEQLSGIMIWELGQDNYDSYSLLDLIDEVIQMSISFVTAPNALSLHVYPNPFQEEIRIETNESVNGHVALSDLHGRMLLNKKLTSEYFTVLKTGHLPNGIYTLHMISNNQIVTKRLIKQ